MNGRNAGQKCLDGWIWIIHYKVTQKCGKAQQPTLGSPHFATCSIRLPREIGRQEHERHWDVASSQDVPPPRTRQRFHQHFHRRIQPIRQVWHDPPEMAEPFFFSTYKLKFMSCIPLEKLPSQKEVVFQPSFFRGELLNFGFFSLERN